MSARLVIKNGRVVDPAQNIDRVCDVAIEDGFIRQVGEASTPPAVK